MCAAKPKKKPKKIGSYKPISLSKKDRSSPLTKLERELLAKERKSRAVLVVAGKKFGKVVASTPGVSSGHPNCPAQCAGTYVDRLWIHTLGCRYQVILWFAHGFTSKDWTCPYDCSPTKLASGLTHKWNCAFWSKEGKRKTPFDIIRKPA